MNRLTIRILLIIFVLAMSALACVDGGDGSSLGGNGSLAGNNTSVSSLDATATFGAEQFHLQLTAVVPSSQ